MTNLPEIPDEDADFTPDLARKIIAKYQELLGNAQAVPAPVAWRLTDGEGDYEYLTEEPSDQSRAWSRRYGREWEPLYASPISSTER